MSLLEKLSFVYEETSGPSIGENVVVHPDRVISLVVSNEWLTIDHDDTTVGEHVHFVQVFSRVLDRFNEDRLLFELDAPLPVVAFCDDGSSNRIELTSDTLDDVVMGVENLVSFERYDEVSPAFRLEVLLTDELLDLVDVAASVLDSLNYENLLSEQVHGFLR